jgi:DNA-directed RNA polymerase subunit RPC12/RpoP
MRAPDTVTEAVRMLGELGYTDELRLSPEGLRCGRCGTLHEPGSVVVAHTLRFEGPTDPADEAIVLAVECPACGHRGVIVSAYGAAADPATFAVLNRLAR